MINTTKAIDCQNAAIPSTLVTRRLPSTIVDPGKVRLGGQGPVFRPAAIADTGKVRLGGQGPIFR